MYIYIITHPKFPGWVKIGRTNDLKNRLDDYQTHCPLREFKIDFSIETKYYYSIEVYFDNFIKNNGYEWYNCSPEYAIEKIHEVLERIKIDPHYLEHKEVKNNIKYVSKKNHNIIKYDYTVDNIVFNTLRELSIYIGFSYSKLSTIMYKINYGTIDLNGFKILKHKHY